MDDEIFSENQYMNLQNSVDFVLCVQRKCLHVIEIYASIFDKNCAGKTPRKEMLGVFLYLNNVAKFMQWKR